MITTSKVPGRKYGYLFREVKPSTHRSYSDTHTMMEVAKLPTSVTSLAWMPPVYDQSTEGTCTAFGTKNAREYLSNRYVKNLVPLSAQFQYYCSRLYSGLLTQDSGSTVSAAALSAQIFGICPDKDEPYPSTTYLTVPTWKDFCDANHFRVGNIYSVNTLTDMKNLLNSGWVFVMGFLVYESFESDATAAKGVMTMPLSSEALLGGHAVCVYGYDDNFKFPGLPNGALLCRNSWGNWGDAGNFAMPYGYLDGVDPAYGPYVSDCHMFHLGPVWS